MFFYNVATGIFSALGDSKTPFFFLVCSSLSNIAVDILFVTAFGMGVDGRCVGNFPVPGRELRAGAGVRVPPSGEDPPAGGPEGSGLLLADCCGRVARVAIPSILQQSFVSVGNIVMQSVINPLRHGRYGGLFRVGQAE